MRMKPHPEDDGYRVWLSDNELQLLIDELGDADRDSTAKRIAGELGGYAGLRRDEASKSRPADVAQARGGDPHLRVWEDAAKRDQYRETPIPETLAHRIDALADVGGRDPDDAILQVSPKTLNRWVKKAAKRLYAETGDDAWMYLTFHDLRRTWGTRLLEQGVLPTVVMDWGGWKDWETFRKHYLGEFSPEALKRERGKVEFLGGGRDVEPAAPQNHLTPVGSTHRSSAEQ